MLVRIASRPCVSRWPAMTDANDLNHQEHQDHQEHQEPAWRYLLMLLVSLVIPVAGSERNWLPGVVTVGRYPWSWLRSGAAFVLCFRRLRWQAIVREDWSRALGRHLGGDGAGGRHGGAGGVRVGQRPPHAGGHGHERAAQGDPGLLPEGPPAEDPPRVRGVSRRLPEHHREVGGQGCDGLSGQAAQRHRLGRGARPDAVLRAALPGFARTIPRTRPSGPAASSTPPATTTATCR